MTPNREQIQARDENCNVVVSAGAGSGKTTVLAERYVRLVTEGGLDVEDVLTLTFTNKAAAEMYSRIYRVLSASEHPRASAQLERFSRARISTLDAFCSSIVRGGAARYGISGGFTVDDAAVAQAAEMCAIEILMKNRRLEPVCRFVAARSFDSAVRDFLVDFGVNEVSLVSTASYADLAKKQIDYLEKAVKDTCAVLNGILARLIDTAEGTDAECAKEWAAAAKGFYPLDAGIGAKSLAEAAGVLAAKSTFNLKKGSANDPVVVTLKETIKKFRDKEAPALAAAAGTLRFREDIAVFGVLMDEFAAAFRAEKRAEGVLTFRDIAELSVEILREDRNLRNFYRKRIKAIMIDEFQDNNSLQKELLYLISEKDDLFLPNPSINDLSPDKLFFVGDEKQSIYRFRGADVAVFRGLRDECGREIPMNTNYRSSPELISFFNALFPGVFGAASSPFEAEFHPITPDPEKTPAPEGTPPPVELYLRDDAADGGEDLVQWQLGEALTAAERIARMVRDGEADYADIAVLFRSGSHQSEYERVFRYAGIPFSTAEPRGVWAEGPANDFYAILRLSLFSEDGNAYAAVLRSPFAGLGDDSFVRIMTAAAAKQGEHPFGPAGDWFASEAEKERYLRAAAIYAELRRRADNEGLAPLLRWLWYETGYCGAAADAEHFEYLYTLALDADGRRLCLSAFLDELAPLMGSSEKVQAGGASEKRHGVTFLTIHKSKGLEFKVVILPYTESPGMGDRNDKPWYPYGEFGPVLNFKDDTGGKAPVKSYFYEQGKELNRKKEEAELKRLFYVAATRAEARLVIFGAAKDGQLPAPPDRQRTFLHLISSGFSAAGGGVPCCAVETYTPFSLAEYHRRRRELQTLVQETPGGAGKTADFEKTALPPAPKVSRTPLFLTSPTALEAAAAAGAVVSAEHEARTLADFRCEAILSRGDNAEDTAAADLRLRFGTLCHRVIELMLTESGRDLFGEAAVREKTEREAAQNFRDLGANERGRLVSEALEKAGVFLNSAAGKAAAASRHRASEFAFTLPLKGAEKNILVSGSMDLVYEKDDACVIIDFKTDRALRPEAHRVQLAAYRMAAPAFSDLPPKSFLYYLREGLLVPCEIPAEKNELIDLL